LLIGIGLLAAWRTPTPDILVAYDARMVAVRNPDGRFSVMKTGQDDFTLRNWLAADSDGRGPRDASLTAYARCDRSGCAAQLSGGGVVALASSAEALAEDCARAVVVVTPRAAPPDCHAQTIDRDLSRRHGAAALTRSEDGFSVNFARPPGYERPWTVPAGTISAGPAVSSASSASLVPSFVSSSAPSAASARPPIAAPNARQRATTSLRDATPAQEDLQEDMEAGD